MRNIFVWAISLMAFAVAGYAQITEFPVLSANSSPTSITRGPDGNLWFTAITGSKIGKITTSGAVTEFPTSTFGTALGITAGPDGNLWYTTSGGKIDRKSTRLNSSHTVISYAVFCLKKKKTNDTGSRRW